MKDAKFFTRHVHDWQRRYEALRASFVERLPAYVRLLRHLFMQGKIDFSEPVPDGKTRRRRVDAAIREKIIGARNYLLSFLALATRNRPS